MDYFYDCIKTMTTHLQNYVAQMIANVLLFVLLFVPPSPPHPHSNSRYLPSSIFSYYGTVQNYPKNFYLLASAAPSTPDSAYPPWEFVLESLDHAHWYSWLACCLLIAQTH